MTPASADLWRPAVTRGHSGVTVDATVHRPRRLRVSDDAKSYFSLGVSVRTAQHRPTLFKRRLIWPKIRREICYEIYHIFSTAHPMHYAHTLVIYDVYFTWVI